MAVLTQSVPMTAEELFDLPDDDYKYELVEGELIRMAPTGGEHGVLAVRVAYALQAYVQDNDIGIVSGVETALSYSAAPISSALQMPPLSLRRVFPRPVFPQPIGRLPRLGG